MVTPSFSNGSLFGDYLIDDVLPWQAPIERYRATHVPTEIDVLLCCLDVRALDVTAEDSLAFAEEVRELRGLAHQHLPRIFNGRSSNGFMWVASEYVDGLTLRDMMAAEKAIDSMSVLLLGSAIAKALKSAHEARKHHFRLAPDRIVVTEQLELRKLNDFGLYDLFGHLPLRPSEIAYRPPEQLDEGETDERADIYALGMVIHAALALDEPYAGKGRKRPDDIVRLARLEYPTPLAELRPPPFPGWLDDVVHRLSAKDLALRPATWDAAIAILIQAADRVLTYRDVVEALLRLGMGAAEINKRVEEQPGTTSHTGFRLRPDLEAALSGQAPPEDDSVDSFPSFTPLARPADQAVPEGCAANENREPVNDVEAPSPAIARVEPVASEGERAGETSASSRSEPRPNVPSTSAPRTDIEAPAARSTARGSRPALLPAAPFVARSRPIAASLGLLAGVSIALGLTVHRDRRDITTAPSEQTAEPSPPPLPSGSVAPCVIPPPITCPPTQLARNDAPTSAPQQVARTAPKAQKGGPIPADPDERIERVWVPSSPLKTH